GVGQDEAAAAAGVSRRGFLRGLGGSLAATAVGTGILTGRPDGPGASAEAAEPEEQGGAADTAAGTLPVSLTVNGHKKSARVDPRRTLLEMLRTDFDLTGAKQVCNHGSCGACTVLVDGRPVYSCMTLAAECEGRKVETIEGMAKGDRYHPLQVAFVEKDALMCGFCTPGFLMSSKALLDRNKNPSLDDVKNACAGNLCRCGTYPRIFEAVLDAAKKG
ncbi:MAG TPA: (2Fe-2S)-binding protein, partial [Armatimonadaceae bacterium]|nr:(2Fe-2S)-binding protein [Armatimonadaceae bacterium]